MSLWVKCIHLEEISLESRVTRAWIPSYIIRVKWMIQEIRIRIWLEKQFRIYLFPHQRISLFSSIHRSKKFTVSRSIELTHKNLRDPNFLICNNEKDSPIVPKERCKVDDLTTELDQVIRMTYNSPNPSFSRFLDTKRPNSTDCKWNTEIKQSMDLGRTPSGDPPHTGHTRVWKVGPDRWVGWSPDWWQWEDNPRHIVRGRVTTSYSLWGNDDVWLVSCVWFLGVGTRYTDVWSHSGWVVESRLLTVWWQTWVIGIEMCVIVC